MSIKYSANSPKITEAVVRRFRDELKDSVLVNTPMSTFLPLGLGGVAELVVEAKTTKELVDAVKLSLEFHLPYQVIGAGTGVLASDVGFPGVVIRNLTSSIYFADDLRQVVVDSGVDNAVLVSSAASKSFGGIEYLMAVPGTIGGAAATMAGYAGTGIEISLKELVMFIPKGTDGEITTVPISQLATRPLKPLFDSSLAFKPIILTVRLQLALLTQREIIERISKYKRVRSGHGRNQLGYIFQQPLSLLSNPKELYRIRGEGIWLQKREAELLEIQSKRVVESRPVRDFISNIKQVAENQSYQLAERVDYLGYWPEEYETTNSVNAESI